MTAFVFYMCIVKLNAEQFGIMYHANQHTKTECAYLITLCLQH